MSVKQTLKQLFFPDGIKCIFCDNEIRSENRYSVCDNCSPEFNVQYCERCGKAIKNAARYCHDCKEGAIYSFEQARAPFVYGDSVSSAVYSLKYGNGRHLAPFMAEYMADSYYETDWRADLITFVPLSPKRFKERGYNQAECLAKALSDILRIECKDTLIRDDINGNLAKMNREERAKAVLGTVHFGDKAVIKGKRIILVDDVMTTSATANECAKALKKAKADKVFVLTFATSRVKPLLY